MRPDIDRMKEDFLSSERESSLSKALRRDDVGSVKILSSYGVLEGVVAEMGRQEFLERLATDDAMEIVKYLSDEDFIQAEDKLKIGELFRILFMNLVSEDCRISMEMMGRFEGRKLVEQGMTSNSSGLNTILASMLTNEVEKNRGGERNLPWNLLFRLPLTYLEWACFLGKEKVVAKIIEVSESEGIFWRNDLSSVVTDSPFALGVIANAESSRLSEKNAPSSKTKMFHGI